jgi:hypothetical protein
MKGLLSLFNFDPKTRDGITSITIWLTMLMYFLYISLFIVPISLPREPVNYTFYLFVLFVPAAVKLLFFSGDSISYRNNREARFFQNQFPDRYIAKKYGVSLPAAQHVWFKALDRRESEGEVQRTYQYGYTCRLIYHTRRIAFTFAVVSLLTLAAYTAVSYFRVIAASSPVPRSARLWESLLSVENLRGKLFYLAHVGGIAVYISIANKARDTAPTGVWARWKHINDRNKAWVDQFPSFESLRSFADGTAPISRSSVAGSKSETA